MNQDLERLLKALDAYFEGKKGPDAEALLSHYNAELEKVSALSGHSATILDRVVQHAYTGWKRANSSQFPTLPPQA